QPDCFCSPDDRPLFPGRRYRISLRQENGVAFPGGDRREALPHSRRRFGPDMTAPVLMPTGLQGETFAHVTYHVDGELVPVLTVAIDRVPIYFEHHILLWKDPSVTIGVKPVKGALKRMLAGMQIFVTEARGKGQIAFSRDGVGHIFPLHLMRGQE